MDLSRIFCPFCLLPSLLLCCKLSKFAFVNWKPLLSSNGFVIAPVRSFCDLIITLCEYIIKTIAYQP